MDMLIGKGESDLVLLPAMTNRHGLIAGRRRESAGEAMAKSAARAIGSQIGRQIVRGVLGSIFGGSRK